MKSRLACAFNIRSLTDKMHGFYASLGHHLFEMVGEGAEKKALAAQR